jgi:hypothetical protein
MVGCVELSRSLQSTLAAALAVTALTVLAGGASASPSQLVESGALTMSSDSGDYIGQGLTYSYATPTNPFVATARSFQGENNRVSITAWTDVANADYWVLEFAAPPGRTLAPGTYSDAVRVVSQGSGQPGLDVWGMGRGCNALSGSFTVSDATFGPYGYVQSFHAAFEQHCEGHAAALRGEVSVSNPPPPPPLSVQITITPSAQLTSHGSATVSGTVTCNRPVAPDRSYIQLVVSQSTKTGDTDGVANVAVPNNCSETPTPWQATAFPIDPKTPFTKGSGSARAWVELVDPFFDVFLIQDALTAALSFRET